MSKSVPSTNSNDIHACDICGRSHADHETPKAGVWIHKRCGMREWQRMVNAENRRKTRHAISKARREANGS